MSAVSGATMIGFAPTSILLAHRAPARELDPTMRWTWDSDFHAVMSGATELVSLASFIVEKYEAPPISEEGRFRKNGIEIQDPLTPRRRESLNYIGGTCNSRYQKVPRRK